MIGGRYDLALKGAKENIERIKSGKSNCLPIPFKKFSEDFPGWRRGSYTIITASQKVGKSKLVDYLTVYYPTIYSVEHPDKYNVNVLYFTLEMSVQDKTYEWMSHMLWHLNKERLSSMDLKSLREESLLDEKYIQMLESQEYRKYADYWEEHVQYIDAFKDVKNITEICVKNAEKNGTFSEEGHFAWKDPESYNIIILDNFANIEKIMGSSKAAIDAMSKEFVNLRNKYNYTIIAVQHQSADKEGTTAIQMNRNFPTSDGLADSKTTSRDINALIGIYNPSKYNDYSYREGILKKWGECGKYIRGLSILENRDGESSGEYLLFFDGKTSSFYNIEQGSEEEERCLRKAKEWEGIKD